MSADVHNEMSMIKIYTVHVNRVKSLKDIKLKKISYIFFSIFRNFVFETCKKRD